MSILLEICCGSIDDAIQSEQGGADRVELCSALFLGGLTPSLGTLQEAKKRLKIPVMMMIRPRAGGFCYSEAEMATMERDAESAVANGADGIVFGFLLPDGRIDLARTRRLHALAGKRQSVFHRAFDVTPDPFEALDQLIDLGITRVLTSGQKNSVPEGAATIKRLIDHAAGRIEILPGGGIAPHNLQDVVERTGASQIHLTAWKTGTDTSTHANPAVTFGGALYPSEDRYALTDSALVQQISKAVK
jgi:copper homeostasis protein